MARKKKERVCLLEDKNKVITVKKYYRNKFEKTDEKIFKCSNCSIEMNYKHVYELESKRIINLCFHCNSKVHNLFTNNPKFRKY
jgi:DNA-directed RNA polymerase subunit RPC12/RpoP